MLKVDARAFETARDALRRAAYKVTDQRGLLVHAAFRGVEHDSRLRAATLAALTVLAGDVVIPDDEQHLSGDALAVLAGTYKP
jgi:hypothetical protein